jgi:hypothetical protein
MRKPTQREQLIVHLLDEVAEKLVREAVRLGRWQEKHLAQPLRTVHS